MSNSFHSFTDYGPGVSEDLSTVSRSYHQIIPHLNDNSCEDDNSKYNSATPLAS
jgi:hypothetical protein